jgi:hypothetical protein
MPSGWRLIRRYRTTSSSHHFCSGYVAFHRSLNTCGFSGRVRVSSGTRNLGSQCWKSWHHSTRHKNKQTNE